MSSPGCAVTAELPRWPLAERVSLVLAGLAGLVIEAVAANHPGMPVGLGVLATGALAAGLACGRRGEPVAIELSAAGGRLRLTDGRWLPCSIGTGSRLLGSSLVLHWRAPGRSRALWLTPADLPGETLRLLAVQLAAGRRDADPR